MDTRITIIEYMLCSPLLERIFFAKSALLTSAADADTTFSPIDAPIDAISLPIMRQHSAM